MTIYSHNFKCCPPAPPVFVITMQIPVRETLGAVGWEEGAWSCRQTELYLIEHNCILLVNLWLG